MTGMAVLLFGAAVAYGIAAVTRLPNIPLLLLAGVVLALSGTAPAELLTDTLVLGTTLLLFVNGLELSPNRARRQRATALRVGLWQFFLLAAVGFGTALVLRYAWLEAAYLGLAVSASSTLVVVRLLQRRGQLFEPFGRLVLGVLLLQDLLVLLLIPVVTYLPEGIVPALLGIAATLALSGLSWVTLRWFAPRIQQLDGDGEVMLLVLLAVLFVFIALGDLLRLPLVTGAFLAGVALSRFPISSMARTLLASITEFFSAIFFIALGALIGIPGVGQVAHALVFAAVVIFVTPPLVTAIAERAGMSGRSAQEAGLLLAQTSEISLVICLFGMIDGQISRELFTVIALVTVMTMLLTPFVTTYAVQNWITRHRPTARLPKRRRSDVLSPAGGHVLVLGSGSTGMPLLETILALGHDVLVIDDDPVVIQRLRDADIPSLRGDASDIDLLERAGARRARIIMSTIRRPQDNRTLLEFARGVPTLIRVFEDADAEWIRSTGGVPIVASHAAADEMMKWFDRRFGGKQTAPPVEDGAVGESEEEAVSREPSSGPA